jgi:tRNA A-37 threonylcarbamoyl transferase component Bud32
LDEGTLIYNTCQGILENLFNATSTESSDDTSEAAEAHRERKFAMEKYKRKAEAPSKFVYGSESFVSSLYNNETGLQEMWFTTPITNLEQCTTAMFQLEHGELYAAGKRGGGGGGDDNREFFESNDFRRVFGGSTSSPVRMVDEAASVEEPARERDSDEVTRETFSDLLQQQTGKLEELLNADQFERGKLGGQELSKRLSIDKTRVSGEFDDIEKPGVGSPRSPEPAYLSSAPLPPPSATRTANEGEAKAAVVRETRVASDTSHALQARLARRGVKANGSKEQIKPIQQQQQIQQPSFDPFAPAGSPPQIERKPAPPSPKEESNPFNDNYATLRAGTSGLLVDQNNKIHSDDISIDEDADEGEVETERVVSPPTIAQEPSSTEEKQYHIRYQATHQAWRENMVQDVKDLHDLTCSDFKKSDIHLDDFGQINDFKEIGAGAFACVYRATWNGNVIAVKKLSTQIGQPMTLKTIRDFRTEASLQRTLKHENIVQLLAVCTQPLSLVMEFVPRGNLFALLGDNSVSLDWLQRLRIGLGAAKGMAYLHAQNPIIIHRDLKSLNLLLTEDLDCKVTDFGLSRFKAENDDKMTGQCGTYHWMAPEVINSERYTEKADVYSIAIILWEVYTRAIPYDGMKPVQAAMHVIQGGRLVLPEGTPNWFNHLVCTCWDASPDNRPSMDYVKQILEKAVLAVSNKQR